MATRIGPLHVRRSILVNAAPTRVWQEFSSLERVRAWLGIGQEVHEFEPVPGAVVRLSVEIDGERRYFGGPILVSEAARELTFENQWQSPSDWPVPTFWTYRLRALYGGTLVAFFHHGFERLGNAAADNLQGYEEGWTVRHLKALRAIAESP